VNKRFGYLREVGKTWVEPKGMKEERSPERAFVQSECDICHLGALAARFK